MSSNSSSASKRLRTETSFEDEKTYSADDGIVVGSTAAESNMATTENARNAFVNPFTDDILPEIFGNLKILSFEDLLNFRLVSRCWRDAATSVLLKQNIGKIAVNFGKVTIHENGNAVARFFKWITRNLTNVENGPRSYNYFNTYEPTSFLSDLSALISTSPKFPCNSIDFHSKCTPGFDNLCLPPDVNRQDPNDKDLRHFFSLYGKTIRKLSLSGKVSKEALQNLLYVHMPHLTCLDLQGFGGFQKQPQPQETSRKQVPCLSRPPILKINEIVLGTRFHVREIQMDFVKDLISVSPNLSSIRNADVTRLLILLEMGKSHLIKDLEFDPTFSDIPQISNLTDSILEHNLSNLKLSKLKIELYSINGRSYSVAIKFLRAVLSSSKDSLKYLEIALEPSYLRVDHFILPLPNLQCLKLIDFESSELPLHRKISISLQDAEKTINPANYFPRLREVNLQMEDQRNSSNKLMGFFWLKNLGSDRVTTISEDTLPTVTYLEVTRFHFYQRNMSKLFPNVSRLKIQCLLWSSLPNWIWTAFPKLERFEVSIQSLGMETNRVDSFFTGISPELCATLESARASTAIKSTLVRSQPYIGDCKNLKEFKLNFERSLLCSKFASEVTAVYGFQNVTHRTKIIISFESIKMSSKEMDETRQLLEPVAAFVEIRMKK